MPGSVTVLAFAGARDVLGTAELSLDFDVLAGSAAGVTAGAVMDAIVARHPGLGPHRPSIRLAVNGSYVDETEPVKSGDEVALIPPVAGG